MPSYVRKQAPAPLANERTEFVQSRTQTVETKSVFLTVLPWAAEVKAAAGRDVVLSRADPASIARTAGLEIAGTAAVLRQPIHGNPVIYVFGQSLSDRLKQPLPQ